MMTIFDLILLFAITLLAVAVKGLVKETSRLKISVRNLTGVTSANGGPSGDTFHTHSVSIYDPTCGGIHPPINEIDWPSHCHVRTCPRCGRDYPL